MADADCLSPNSLGALLGAAPWSRSSQGLGTPILDELGTAFEAREGLGRAPGGGEQRAGDRPKSVTPTPGDALLDERTLHEIYTPPFAAAVAAGAGAAMSASPVRHLSAALPG